MLYQPLRRHQRNPMETRRARRTIQNLGSTSSSGQDLIRVPWGTQGILELRRLFERFWNFIAGQRCAMRFATTSDTVFYVSVVKTQKHQPPRHCVPTNQRSRGIQSHGFILVVTDMFSRWVEAFPIGSSDTTRVIRILEEEVFSRWGDPRAILSDNGPQFISKAWKDACNRWETQHWTTAIYHPRANPAERRKQEIKKGLHLQDDEHRKWDLYLPAILLLLYLFARMYFTITTYFASTLLARGLVQRLSKIKSLQFIFSRWQTLRYNFSYTFNHIRIHINKHAKV